VILHRAKALCRSYIRSHQQPTLVGCVPPAPSLYGSLKETNPNPQSVGCSLPLNLRGRAGAGVLKRLHLFWTVSYREFKRMTFLLVTEIKTNFVNHKKEKITLIFVINRRFLAYCLYYFID